MSSYISITQKPTLTKHKHKPLVSARRATRYLLFFLAIWILLNLSRILVFSSLPCGGPRKGGKDGDRDEFWTWAQSGTPGRVRPCLNFSNAYRNSSVGEFQRRYMMAVVSGGLNQQRHQIIDAVVIARIIGATLVLPILQVNQVWGDESEFADIFDDRHFKEVLRDDVTIVSSLPVTHLHKRRVRSSVMPFNADENWVQTHYKSQLGKHSILLIRELDSRLSKDLNIDLQKLRCKVAFEALKFQPKIEKIAERLVKRIGKEGPYMALHLRLEKDVWVRTGCQSGLGRKADREIDNERALNPQFLTSRSNLTSRDRYVAGLCPLNANEISRMLKAFGAPKSTRIYWAGGEPFGGQKALEPLRARFPNLHNKWSLASHEELDGLEDKPSILAALDYLVCLKSKVFMASHGGNMANSLQGHRTYMGYGKPIKPNKKVLVQLFMNRSLDEDAIEKEIKHVHTEYSDFNSPESTSPGKDLVSLPVPNCICSSSSSS